MIFGFNTDVKHGDTTYHVQSEPRQSDLLLQTQVFVKGQCVAKRTASYAVRYLQPGFTEEHMHELLREQHGDVVEMVKAGNVQTVGGVNSPVEDIGGGLSLRWLNKEVAPQNGSVTIRVGVSDKGTSVAGARVFVQPEEQLLDEVEATTGADGVAETTVAIASGSSKEVPLMVTATHAGRSGTRRFRLKRS